MKVVTPQQMEAIFTVTDSLSIHREAVIVPLGPEGKGNVRLVGNKIEVTVPDEVDFETWREALGDAISNLDLTHVRRADG